MDFDSMVPHNRKTAMTTPAAHPTTANNTTSSRREPRQNVLTLFGAALALLANGIVADRASAAPFAYVPNGGSGSGNTVSVIDLGPGVNHNQVIKNITVGLGPAAVAVNPSGTRAYVTNYTNGFGNTISVIDTASNTVIAGPGCSGTCSTPSVGAGPFGIATSPDGTRVYVLNSGTGASPGNTVSVLDTSSNSVIATI